MDLYDEMLVSYRKEYRPRTAVWMSLENDKPNDRSGQETAHSVYMRARQAGSLTWGKMKPWGSC